MTTQHPIHATVKDWRNTRPVKIEVSHRVALLNELLEEIDLKSHGAMQHVHDPVELRRFVWSNPALFNCNFLRAFSDALEINGYRWL